MRKHDLRCLVFGLGTIVLAACGAPTPYQPATDGYGYREQPIAEDRYRIIVTGNRLTPRARVEDYLLFRAAELTRRAGAQRFTVVTRDVERSTSYWATQTGSSFHRGLSCGQCGNAYTPHTTHTTLHPRDQYRASGEILIHRDGAAPNAPTTYRASEVIARLRPRVQNSEPN